MDRDEDPDSETATDTLQWLGSRCERGVFTEEEEFECYAVAFECLHAHDEEEACEDALRDEVEDDEERTGHGSEGEEALCEVGDALFDDVVDFCGDVPFVGALFIGVGDYFGDAERGGVEWCLGDEAVGEGNPEEAGDASGEAEEENVPVETGGFAEGKFGALGDEGRD